MPTSISLRSNIIPNKVILLKDDCVIPRHYTTFTSYNCKYIVNVPTGATNPGTNIGNADHIHSAVGAHTHTVPGGSHNHPCSSTAGDLGGNNTVHGEDAQPHVSAGHGHIMTLGTTVPAITISDPGTHTHDVQNNDPLFRTYKFIQKGSIVALRESTIPFKTSFIWPKTIATIPSKFTTDANIFTRHIKGVGISPGTNGGRTTHGHANLTHNHALSLVSHLHSLTTLANAPTHTVGFGNRPGVPGHGHTKNTLAASNTTTNKCSDSPGHTHDTLSVNPASKESLIVKKDSISLRRIGIPFNSISFWNDTLASIPTNFGLANGTGGTDNYLGKFLVGVPDGCTNPGTNVGADTHTHNNIAHTHANITFGHTHGGTGASSTFAGQFTTHCFGPQGGIPALTGHSHAFGTTTGTTPTPGGTLPSAGGHTHDTINLRPVSTETALIQKV